MAVVTNIDADHMDTYGHDFARLKQAFVEFIHKMPFYGAAVVCTDDPACADRADDLAPIVSYGFGADAMVRAVDVEAHGATMRFTCSAATACACRTSPSPSTCPGDTTS
jgi:UDP-N-acetylmuramate--alanine ligase